jgi:hypothetical protein
VLMHIAALQPLPDHQLPESKGLLDKNLIAGALSHHIHVYASTRGTNEVAWAVWMAILFDVRLSKKIGDIVSGLTDNVCAVLAVHASTQGVFEESLNTNGWASRLAQNSIYTEDWLLTYELPAHDWLQITDGSDYIHKHQCFGALMDHNVRFYDEASYLNSNNENLLKWLHVSLDLYAF